MIFIRAALLSLGLEFSAGAGITQDFQKGMAAAQKGDYATALKEFQVLAEQGDNLAQYELGIMRGFNSPVQLYPRYDA